MDRYVLALDMGTSSLHCMLADFMGCPIATASVPLRFFTPDCCPSYEREFDPNIVTGTFRQLTGTLLKQEGIKSDHISAIGITSQRQGIVFLGDTGNELYCSPNIDLRAIFEGGMIDEELGEEIYATTGHCPSLLLAPARLRWLCQNRPETYSKVRTILTVGGWLFYKLTGNLMSEPSLEVEAGLLDVTKRERCPDLMAKLGVPMSLLPPLAPTGTPISALTDRMAASWGLKAGTPVVVAGPDTQCGLLGMGLLREGQAGAVLGWSGALQVLTTSPRRDEGMRTWAGCYLVEGMWVAESNLGDAGNAYRWLKDTLLGCEAPFEEAEQLARQASAASEGVTAFLGPGPLSSTKAGLKMGGLIFPTPLSFQETTRGQLLRAALENLAYSAKGNLAVLREVADLDIRTLYLGGAMASSQTLTETLANVLGFPVKRASTPQVSTRGAAIAAAVSTNASLTLEQAAETAARDCQEVQPGTPSDIAQHQEHYQDWLNLYSRLG